MSELKVSPLTFPVPPDTTHVVGPVTVNVIRGIVEICYENQSLLMSAVAARQTLKALQEHFSDAVSSGEGR